MNWDAIAAATIFLGLVAWALWGLTRPHKPLTEKDRRDFNDAGEI